MKKVIITAVTEEEIEDAGLGCISGKTPSFVKQYGSRTNVAKSFNCHFSAHGGSFSRDALGGNFHISHENPDLIQDVTGEFTMEGNYVTHSIFAKVDGKISEIHLKARF